MNMNIFLIITIFFLAIRGVVHGFSVDHVDISIDEMGNAAVQMNYQANHIEVGAYSLATVVMDVKNVAKERLEAVFQKTVSVQEISPSSTRFVVQDFAQVENETIISPSFEYLDAEMLFDERLKWIKDALSLDFTPKITKIQFLDGYYESFENLDAIPEIIHTLMK